jgi:hypothetical protein
MLRKSLIFSFLLCLSIGIYAQNSFNIGIGSDLGIPMAGEYAESRKVLKSNSGHFINFSLYFNAILSERIGFEVGAGQNNQVIKFKDHEFKDKHNGKYEIQLRQKNPFPNLEASVFYIQPIFDNTALYFKVGYRWNYPGNKTKAQSDFFNLDASQINAQSSYTQKSEGIYGEIGIRGRNNSPFFGGLKYYYGLTPNVEMDYSLVQKYASYQDHFTSKGSFIGLSLGVNIRAFEWDYPSFNLRMKPKKKSPSKPTPLPTPVIAPEHRQEQIIRRIALSDPVITIKVYDPNKVDNDIVSIKLNNDYVVSNLVVVKEPWVKEITLRKGENRLTFQAMNLGKYAPNTAAMTIQAGREMYQLQFNTTLELNQVLIITIP